MELHKRQVFLCLCLISSASILITYQMPASPVKWLNKSKGKEYFNPDEDIINDRLNEVISEEVALQYRPCTDTNLAASPTLSTLRILGSPNKVYNIGDKIFAQATLFDSYGKQKTTGGDHIRARMYNEALKAYAPGAVYDHNNGSYTLIFEALWSGVLNISATIAYTREALTVMYRVTKTLDSLISIKAKYKTQKNEMVKLCHPDVNYLVATTNYTDVCNLTSRNSGMPWYCGKPTNPKLKCTDWKSVEYVGKQWNLLLSKCELELVSKRKHHQVLTKVLKVAVEEPIQNNLEGSIKYYQPSASCVNYNTTRLWYEKYTSGFFFNMQWKLRHCKGFHQINLENCLRNKTLYLMGDSTVRQWYEDILERYNCIHFTEKRTRAKWFKPASCKVASNNFTVSFTWHSQPLYLRFNWIGKIDYRFTSVTHQLEKIGANVEAIVLIHVFSHMVVFHSKYYRDKMIKIRYAVEKLLNKNRKVKIFIKLPHTYTNKSRYTGIIKDFFGYIFSSIIFESFRGLHDKVTVLDNKDATNSIASVDVHPEKTIVSSMVDQMFTYVCK